MKFKDTDVSVHQSRDNTDPGFALKGFKLRWLSGAVEARRAGRIWTPLKVSMLPDRVLNHLKDKQPAWLSTGDTIRRRDLTLAFAPQKLADDRRRELLKQQHANEAVLRGKVSLGHEITTEKDNEHVIGRAATSEEFR